jgi:hypothetical protein
MKQKGGSRLGPLFFCVPLDNESGAESYCFNL